MFVIEVVAVGLDFLEATPLCIPLMYYAGMSWKGEAKLTPAARVALSVSGTISEGGR